MLQLVRLTFSSELKINFGVVDLPRVVACARKIRQRSEGQKKEHRRHFSAYARIAIGIALHENGFMSFNQSLMKFSRF